MTIFERLTNFVHRVFKTNLEIFLEALKHSPNAQGYVSGSITELLLKKKLEEEYGFEVKRIREKWEGRKHPNHHGDFYFRKPESNLWYVVESKGVKSNSEKWHKLYSLHILEKLIGLTRMATSKNKLSNGYIENCQSFKMNFQQPFMNMKKFKTTTHNEKRPNHAQ
jgi:hypothetical protein